MGGLTAVLVGATGLVGAACLRELLHTDAYSCVMTPVRRPIPASDPRVLAITTDFQDVSKLPIQAEADVFSTLGTTIRKAGSQDAFRQVDYEIPLKIAKAALAAGARQFLLVSSVGADSHASNFYLRTKGELEDVVQGLGFRAVHVFRPSLLLGERKERRAGEVFAGPVLKLAGPLLVGGWRKYRAVQASDVARAMVAAARLHNPGVHVYHYDEIRSLASRP